MRALLAEELLQAPALRRIGAVSGMLEEFAEAALLAAWLAPAASGGVGGGGGTVGVLLLPDDATLLDGALSRGEYLGGVCDLVGELGRYAVRRATERDAAAVRAVLATAVAIQSALLSLGDALPRATHKKMDGLRTAVCKLQPTNITRTPQHPHMAACLPAGRYASSKRCFTSFRWCSGREGSVRHRSSSPSRRRRRRSQMSEDCDP